MSTEISKKFDELLNSKDLDGLIQLCKSEKYIHFNQRFFYLSVALLEKGNYEESIEAANCGLEFFPTSPWGVHVKYRAMKKLSSKRAIDFLFEEIITTNIRRESLLVECINELVALGDFSRASSINDKRSVFQKVENKKYCVCIQTFNKADTLKSLFDSLLQCTNSQDFDVIILQDSHLGSKKQDEYAVKVQAVTEIISHYSTILANSFNSFEYITNRTNMGTAPSCRKLLDHASSKYDGFLFLEDDCILAKDTLAWASFVLENLISSDGPQFGTGESIFFDYSRGTPPNQSELESLRSAAGNLSKYYCKLGFVPSTCFITKSEIWNKFSSIRSFPKGPESLNKFYESIGGKTIFPILARVSDIGMEHEDGYSTANLGKGNVKEIKHTYLTSEFCPCYIEFESYDGNLDLVFSATSKIHKAHIKKLNDELKSNQVRY